MIAEGRYNRSRLGIFIDDLKNDPDYLNLDGRLAPDTREGVIVAGIISGGPAFKSGLRPGDVITAVDGKSVKTMQQLRDEVCRQKTGTRDPSGRGARQGTSGHQRHAPK